MRNIARLSALTLALTFAACAPFGEAPDEDVADEEIVKKKDPVEAEETASPAESETGEPRTFLPTRLPAPAIVLLHGAEGGSDEKYVQLARKLAAQGFVTVAMCWFGCTGTSARPSEVPLETVTALGERLKSSTQTTGKVALFGWDIGAEAALVLSSNAGNSPFGAVAVHGSGKVVTTADWKWRTRNIASGAEIHVRAYPGPMLVTTDTDDLDALSMGMSPVASVRLGNGMNALFTLDLPTNADQLPTTVGDFLHAQL